MSIITHYKPTNLYFSARITQACRGIFDHPLTVVEAPLGYGKTTAVKLLLKKTGVHVLWQSVYDDAAVNIWSGFCKLFAGFDKTCSVRLAGLGLPDDSVSRQAALELITGLSLPGKTVLVIDDYHLIQRNADMHDFIVFIVKNRIADLHIVAITRLAPWDTLDELKLKGYVHHITKEAFELTPDEIATYYKLCGINLKAGQANSLYEYTEGWISALYLLMLNYIKEGCLATEAPEFRVTLTPNIHNLVEQAIYAPLSPELKDFLAAISIFDSFTQAQAAYIWQRPDTAGLLTEIMARNAFLTYEPTTKAYHLHNIITGYLRDRLAGTAPAYRQELYQKAGKWYLQAGEYLKAMRYFYHSGDFDHLLTALEKDKAQSIDGEHRETLIQYFDACPREAFANHPMALRLIGRCLFMFNEKERYAEVCREFMNRIATGGNLDARHRNKLLGEYELMMGLTSFNDIAAIARHYRRACELLQKISPPGDLTESWAGFGSPSVTYLFYRESGKLEQTEKIMMEILSYHNAVTHDTGHATGKIMAAERRFLMGEFENAEIIIHQVFHAGHPGYRPGVRVRGLFLQTRLALVRGDFSAALALLQRLRQDIHRYKLYLFMHTLDLCEAYIYAYLGQKDEIPPWITAGEFKKTRLFFPVLGFVHIVYGRVLLIHGEYAKLIGNADHFVRTASFYPNILGQIYAYIHLAAAYHRIYRKDEALAPLKQALDLAMPDRVVMPFVENCDFIQPLLEQLGGEALYHDAIVHILGLDAACRPGQQKIKTELSNGKKPQLTGREREIAALAAAGLTNDEIGARLFISPNTVKTRLKNVFEKLDINSRALLKQHLED